MISIPKLLLINLILSLLNVGKKNTDEKPKWTKIGPKNAHRLVGKELKSFDQALKNYSKEHKQAQIKPRPRWFSSWYISTDNQESNNTNDQLVQIYDLIKDKVDILNELRDEYKLTYSIQIVPKIENGENPALFFDHYIIEFAYKIHAVIDIDQYLFS